MMAQDKHDAVRGSAIVDALAAQHTGDSLIHQADGSGGAGPLAQENPSPDRESARLICLVAAEQADALLLPLREHFAAEPLVAVLVERRTLNPDNRPVDPAGRTNRRAPVAERDPVRALPPELRHEAPHLRLVQRMDPLRRTHEDTQTEDLVGKCLAMEPDAVSELWWRVSERVLARLGLRLGHLGAEGSTREVLGRILDELPNYEPKQGPLTAWLDTVVDRYAQDRAQDAPRADPAVPDLYPAPGSAR
jgi:hypothetical protein